MMAITKYTCTHNIRDYEDEEKTHMVRPGKSTLKIDEGVGK